MTECCESSDRWPEKRPTAKLQYAVNFEQECARRWAKATDFASSVAIRVYPNSAGAGYQYSSSGGRSGGREPTWGASTVSDGSITWTRQAISSSSLIRTITGTPTWSADSGITVSGASISGMLASAYIEGGTDGNEYAVTVTATMSDGEIVPIVVTLPVAA